MRSCHLMRKLQNILFILSFIPILQVHIYHNFSSNYYFENYTYTLYIYIYICIIRTNITYSAISVYLDNYNIIHLCRSQHLTDLSSSINTDDDADFGPSHREGKKVLTIWTTGFTTLTVSTTSYYQGITVSVSLACNSGNAVNSCFG